MRLPMLAKLVSLIGNPSSPSNHTAPKISSCPVSDTSYNTWSLQEHSAAALCLIPFFSKPAVGMSLVHQRLLWLEDHRDVTLLVGL